MIPSQFPWPDGSTCRIAFVGEAPAEEELLEQIAPLVGASGRKMGQLLRTAGLAKPVDAIPRAFYPGLKRGLRPLLWERSAFMWTNVFSEKLPDNDVSSWCASSREREAWGDQYTLPRIEGSGYLRPEYLFHLSRLSQELQLVRPTLVVPLGGTALWAFTGQTEILSARGAVGKARYICPGTKLLPTFHPAHVIHQHKTFSVVTSDLIKALKESAFPQIRLPKREIWIEPTLKDLSLFAGRYFGPTQWPLAVDIETAAGQITCFGIGTASHAIVVPFVDYRQPTRSYWQTAQEELSAWSWVKEVCENSDIPKLLQNGPYDIYWLLKKKGIKMLNYAHDTRLMHHALFQELPKSLAFMGATYANQGAWKLMREKRSDKRDE